MENDTCKTLYYTAEESNTNSRSRTTNLSSMTHSVSLTDLVNISEAKIVDSDIKSITMHSTPLGSLNLKNFNQSNIDFTPSPVNDNSLNDSDLNVVFNTTADFEKNLIEFEAKLHSIILMAKHSSNSMADLTSGSQMNEMDRIKILLAEKKALKKYRQFNKLMCKSIHFKKRLKKLRIRI